MILLLLGIVLIVTYFCLDYMFLIKRIKNDGLKKAFNSLGGEAKARLMIMTMFAILLGFYVPNSLITSFLSDDEVSYNTIEMNIDSIICDDEYYILNLDDGGNWWCKNTNYVIDSSDANQQTKIVTNFKYGVLNKEDYPLVYFRKGMIRTLNSSYKGTIYINKNTKLIKDN